MDFLLVNDDGVYAEGLQALRQEMEKVRDANVYVVAPDRERSATGHAITMHKPLHVDTIDLPGSRSRIWKVNGTPADCTKLAIEAILDRRPDMVLSGINRGPNLGTDVLYSGTVSAAIEGVLLGIPAIAVSLTAWENLDYGYAARFARQLALVTLERGLPPNTLLNVNVPALEESEIAGVAITRVGVRQYRNVFDRRIDPRGRTYYWMAGEAIEDNDPDTDVSSIRQNLVSISPMQLSLTNQELVDVIRHWNVDTHPAVLEGGGGG